MHFLLSNQLVTTVAWYSLFQELNSIVYRDSMCSHSVPNMAAVNRLSEWEACECLSQQCQMQWGVTISQTNHVASLQASRARMRHRITQLQWELKLLSKQDNSMVGDLNMEVINWVPPTGTLNPQLDIQFKPS